MDALMRALIEHHYEHAPKKLKDRCLPVVITKQGKIYMPRKKPKPVVIPLPPPNGVEFVGPSTLQRIANEVCQQRGVTAFEFTSSTKKRNVVHARWEYCYRARSETKHSLSRIGSLAGCLDHSTVYNAIRHYPKIANVKALPPPPRRHRESFVATTCQFTEAIYNAIQKLAMEKNLTKSDIIRDLVNVGLQA